MFYEDGQRQFKEDSRRTERTLKQGRSFLGIIFSVATWLFMTLMTLTFYFSGCCCVLLANGVILLKIAVWLRTHIFKPA